MKTRFSELFASRSLSAGQYEALRSILLIFGGGTLKRIDENRELLELIQKEAPVLLANHPYLASWLKANDEVFLALRELAVSMKLEEGRFPPRENFPREWPSKS